MLLTPRDCNGGGGGSKALILGAAIGGSILALAVLVVLVVLLVNKFRRRLPRSWFRQIDEAEQDDKGYQLMLHD